MMLDGDVGLECAAAQKGFAGCFGWGQRWRGRVFISKDLPLYALAGHLQAGPLDTPYRPSMGCICAAWDPMGLHGDHGT